MKILYVYSNINGDHYDNYHFGLASITTVTENAGHEVKVSLITKIDEYDLFCDRVKKFEPDLIGFSSVSSQWNFVKDMAKLAKGINSNIFIVAGGVHPTICPDCLLETQFIDGLIRGESEYAVVEFIEKIETERDYKSIDNYAYSNNGKLIINKLRPLENNLDNFPHPSKTTYPYEQSSIKQGYAPFFFTRGCPYTCTYCSNQSLADIYGRKRNYPRFRSPESCIQEIEGVMKLYGPSIRHIFIGDDIFGLNHKWREEFCTKYKERIKNANGDNVKFMILQRVEFINDNILTLLKEAGCFRIFFGVESGDEGLRKNILRRRMSEKKIVKAFDMCHEYGLETLSVNIIGFPGETEDMIKSTVSLNKRLKPTDSGVNIFYPYKGTALGDECFRDGLVDLEKYKTFSLERRESVMKYPKKQLDMINYYYDNWQMLIYPMNVKKRLEWFLKKIGMLNTALVLNRKLKSIIQS